MMQLSELHFEADCFLLGLILRILYLTLVFQVGIAFITDINRTLEKHGVNMEIHAVVSTDCC